MASASETADWSFPNLLPEGAQGRLVSVTMNIDDDERFTSQHLAIASTFEYPKSGISVQHVVWAYPNAPGLRTQLFVKRTGKNLPIVAQASAPAPPLVEVVQGAAYTAPNSAAVAGAELASNLYHAERVELHLRRLEPERKHRLGLSWWDWGGRGRTQSVMLTSVDGESRATVVPPTKLPAWNPNRERPAELSVEIPPAMLVDGSVRMLVDRHEGDNANLSEVWLYAEENPPASGEFQAATSERAEELAAHAPPGYHLAMYFDAGGVNERQELAAPPTARVDFLPLSGEFTRRYSGYFNDLQHRNRPETPVLREELRQPKEPLVEQIDWANLMSCEQGESGVIVLKESHKCANQPGVDTGAFEWDASGLANTGAGLPLSEVNDDYQWCWASWCLVYSGGDVGRELAVKQFDRARFPVNLATDQHIFNVLWSDSSEDQSRWHRGGNTQREVEEELKSCADLGIDCVLIDDGWYHPRDKSNWNGKWRPDSEVWPEGWNRIKGLADERDQRLGLWGVAQQVSVTDMLWNWRQLNALIFKLDFANLDSRHELDEMRTKAREYISQTNHTSNILWDNTENAPRFGYYWLREAGLLHSMNRKHVEPAEVVYVPWITLRDIWLLGRYQNLNQILLTTCIPSRVPKTISDASEHSADYALATTLMGVPQIQASTRDYSATEREQVRKLITAYRPHQQAIFESQVTPIGSQPTNASWTGFQALSPGGDSGYFLFFREHWNAEPAGQVVVHGCQNRRVRLQDLLSGDPIEAAVGVDNQLHLTIEKAPGYRFFRYELIP